MIQINLSFAVKNASEIGRRKSVTITGVCGFS